ncbi:hypothetical protein BAUCODRAFT_127543 [Baudoinia panamericana UAMH 10762]|uniref:Uncharacterized protein n=1 Tax=Baudoinia panamericana (strain UAMH 10762) TaxID=717646 RepID=M2MWB6_BAUPA|nr:uncharacterized protein BAUCODRAFT_127543 [Baudoinia panamericana UAMH 10762]EMC90874.1 hypothetical protein BAUCODRAFT_127543 [Baudoinia panamericana UAMH 10762]
MSPPFVITPRHIFDTPPDSATTTEPPSTAVPGACFPPSPPPSPKATTRSYSPSAADDVFRALRLHHAGHLPHSQDWQTFRLKRAAFADLQQRLSQEVALLHHYSERVRYDYDPEAERFTLRMPTWVHELYISLVRKTITDAVNALAEKLCRSEDGGKRRVGEALRRVYEGGSPTLRLCVPSLEGSSQESDGEEMVTRRSPDATWIYESVAASNGYPPLVLEVSYSQQRKDLPRLAESYIVDSSHGVRCVVGLDIPYASSTIKSEADSSTFDDWTNTPATVSVWRAAIETDAEGDNVGICRQDVDSADLCGTQSESSTTPTAIIPPSSSLELDVQDFLPPHITASLPSSAIDSERISIPFTTLHTLLTQTIERTTQGTSSSSVSDQPTTAARPPLRFRKRKRSPSEELSDDREDLYLRQELSDIAKEARRDEEWAAAAKRRSRSRGRRVVVRKEEEASEGEEKKPFALPRRRSERIAEKGG